MIKRLVYSATYYSLLSSVLLGLFSSELYAQHTEPNYAKSNRLGQQLFQSCTSCHGKNAEGIAALGAPRLAGQLAPYLERAMGEFLSGKRGQEDSHAQQMAAISGLFKEPKQRRALSVYLNKLDTKTVAVPTRSSDPAYRLYQASCGGCHGVSAEGNEALNSPRLAGLDADYIERQLQHFKAGRRGTSSRYAKQMQIMANTLKNTADVKLLSQYISTL